MTIPAPISMLAELTHRCPLSCPYCSNPLELTKAKSELSATQWADIFQQAAALGVLQLHLSGGEPASRRDLTEIVTAAHKAGLYTNLITSGIGLSENRLAELDAAGLDHVQLSLQGMDAALADEIGGYKGGYERKMQVAGWIRARALPLTLNVVFHRRNLHQLPEAVDLALELGARRVEIATVQFHGWALQNRAALMPSREQAQKAHALITEARARLRGQLAIDYVPADYQSEYPKKCMGGWGTTGFNISPEGLMLPCHAAQTIPHLTFDNVCDMSLHDIWYNSETFNVYRGTEWMQEPCRSCERKQKDFGGCRCQAMALAGDASATDPTCSRSTLHCDVQDQAQQLAASKHSELIYRQNA